MIEISNEELAKVLNLWTGTEDWCVDELGYLDWEGLWQRRSDGGLVAPSTTDVEAHDLVKFMLKERKNPGCPKDVFYPSCANAPKYYVEWVKDWEERYVGMSQEELCIPPSEQVVDHSVPADSKTKAERFYTFLATPQLDISPGLWGIAAMARAPVRGGLGGWAREDVGALSDCHFAQSEYRTVSDMCEV